PRGDLGFAASAVIGVRVAPEARSGPELGVSGPGDRRFAGEPCDIGRGDPARTCAEPGDPVAGVRDDAGLEFRGHPSTITPSVGAPFPYTPPRACSARGAHWRHASIWDAGGGCRRVDATEDRRSSSCASTRIEALLCRGARRCHRVSLLENHAPCACAGAFLFSPWGGRGRCHAAAWHPYTLGVTMAQKDATVAALTKSFEHSNAVLLTEYRGLTVAQLKQLRNEIRQSAEYAVVKNTLTTIAANNAGI